MVKQGKFAKSSKQKQIKQILKRKKQASERTIPDSELEEFLLVRFGLTLKKRVAKKNKESVQRFLIEWIGAAQDMQTWSFRNLFPVVLQRININVPWQFYRQIETNYNRFQNFMKRELKAVPLKERKTTSDEIDDNGVQEIIAGQLAANTFIATTGGNPELLKKVSQDQLEAVVDSFSGDQEINWDKVKEIFDPIGFEINQELDDGTKEWLASIS
ncbi:hypothetical protein [Lentilactobacillus sp. Marseille-Q4993]|uniref:hypothetical protein n=1 Tax=Lentilactobacillus sp. Marseille-Q4993 TaxID=3039492 RepID=UPI0024BBF5D6|nr:hypothetical protein [Lentilactobacillus sp. Marseille-Q4993]